MKSFFLLFLFVAGFSPLVQAQLENNIWCFGWNRSLDFNGPAPVAGTSKVRVFEGSASVCDATGGLLFYLGSDTLWDRNHQYMPNGTGISGNHGFGSSYKGVGIIRFPFDPVKYFVITTDAIEQLSYNAYYSVVDMSLNGGLGDVVPGQKNILLDTNVAEGVTLIPMAACGGHWIVLHRKGNKDLLAYRVDANGIAANPVISQGAIAPPAGPGNGYTHNANNAGNGFVASGIDATELASFDNSTGLFSNIHILDTTIGLPFFSPDDSKLFFTNVYGLYQVNLSLVPNVTAVLGSLVRIDTGYYQGARLGPDQKLYLTRMEPPPSLGTAIARMHTPNALGTAVTLERNFISGTPSLPFFELGNPAAVTNIEIGAYSWLDTVICTSPPVTLQGNSSYQSFLWITGSTAPQETFTQEGVYWLRGIKNCVAYMDSFRLRFQQLQYPLLGPDTSICHGDSLVLAPAKAGPLYRWQDGSMAASYTVNEAGLYTALADSGVCQYKDSIKITVMDPLTDILQPDTSICAGTPFILQAASSPEGTLRWSNGESGNTITVTQEGIYTVTATNVCGTFSDAVEIKTEDCDCRAFIPNVFSPNGDGNNDRLRVYLACMNMAEYDFSLYNRYGQRVFHSNQPEQEWNGGVNGGMADVGTYFYYLKYKSSKGATIVRKGDITLLR